MFRRRSDPDPIAVGALLNNRYRLQQQLGEGGAGIVFKALDEQLSRTVAIKLLMGDSHQDKEKLVRFRSEARSVARLNHPNIITLYDYQEVQGRPYLVIEYIPGQDLWELDNGHAPNLIPFDVSVPIVDDILAALEYSHSHQVIHRDLKPENVMITPGHQVKVMDFGLARIQGQSRLTKDGLVAGTAAYLAPELAVGEPGDHRVDLYALGVMMYELFTGRRPFSGDDPLTIISQHIHAPVVPPQHYNPAIPQDLQDVILKLLVKDPNDRYSEAAIVRADLAPIISRLKRDGRLDIDVAQQQDEASSTSPEVLLDRITRGKMYGREEELAELKRRWDLVRLGEYQGEPMLLISGEAGIGKSRLLREFEVYTSLRDGYLLQGAAHERDIGTPYAIVATILRNYIREQSPEVLNSQMPGSVAGEVVKLVPQLGEKIGYIQPNPALEPAAERARLLDQISRFLLNMAHEQPTLLLLDELHYADPGSLAILKLVLQSSAGTSMLVAGAYRDVALSYSNPAYRLITSLEANNLAFALPLRRLPAAKVQQMLEGLLGNSVSEKFVASIVQATEGNPLFIEETIKSLAVDGQITLKNGRWEQQHTSLVQVPGSIKAVLGKRLDFVKKQTLELLQLAAVIGRRFPLDLLVEASPHTDEVIQWSIEEALTAQLIEVIKIADQPTNISKTDIEVYYQFQHALIRETIYEELRPLRRRQLHRRVALAMESLAGEQPISNPAVLAAHLINGAEDAKAVDYLCQAGEQAHKFYANDEAVEYLDQAIEILEDLALDLNDDERRANQQERFSLLSRIRDVTNMMGGREREFNALQLLLELAEMMVDKKRWVEVMCRLSTYYWHVGSLPEAEDTARQALNVAKENNNIRGEQYALERIARVLWTRRDGTSMDYATQALSLAQEAHDRPREARLTELIGNIYTDTMRDPDKASIFFNQALKICHEIANPYEESWTLWGMAGLAMLIDDYTLALERLQAAKKIAEEIGATVQIGWDLYHMGDAWYNLGFFEEALKLYRQSQEIFETSHHLRGRIGSLISIAMVLTNSGQWDEVGTLLEQALREAEENDDPGLMFRGYLVYSRYYARLDGPENLTSAVRFSNRMIRLASTALNPENALLGHHMRAAGLFALNRLSDALQSSAKAVAELDRLVYLESPLITNTEIYFTHCQIAGALGQFDTAHTYGQKAYADLLRRANLIADEQLRSDFLYSVPLHRQVMAASGQ